MALRIALFLASIALIGCSTDSTVWPYTDSAGEGGGTWLATGFCETSAIAANEKDVFVISCNELVHTPAHAPTRAEEMNGNDNITDTGYVTAVAVDADNLYLAKPKGDWDRGAAGNAHGAIYRRPIMSASMVGLAQSDNPIALAIDSSNVYWIEGPAAATSGSTCSLNTTPKSGGATTTLTTNLPSVVAIAVGSSDIYLATLDTILAVAEDGSSPTLTVAANQDTPMAIAASDSTVWWTTLGKTRSGPGALSSATNGGAVQTLATDLYGPMSVAVDATRVYFSSNQVQGQPFGVTVMSMPRGGGAVKVLGWGQGEPMYLAATSSHLYWTDTEGDSLTSGAIKLAESE